MAGGILRFTHLAMKDVNIYNYPIGKLRVQPVGIIIFAAVMATLGFQVLIQAVEQLITAEYTENLSSDQLAWLYGIMLFATVVKLALWLYCRTLGNKIVRAYAEDHYFDVVTNVVGLVAAILAVSLIGQSAPPEFLQILTYAVMRHAQVKRVDTVRAYTFGVLYFVEVDIKLPEELPLKEAHAIGESPDKT